MDEKIISVALNTVPGLRSVPYHRALERFGSPSGILEGGRRGLLAAVPGIGEETQRAVGGLDPAACWERETARAAGLGVAIVALGDDAYPPSLKEIHDPPPVLYMKGEIRGSDRDAVAIVGSRAASAYGLLTAERLARDLAALGVTVVSGLARGIDSRAHRGALEAKGRTVAVLGSGLDRLYPPESGALAKEIAASGALVTEFPFGTGPEKRHFPLRNRIISGLSLGVVVVEAAARSGALITGTLALEQGREVFAVPGNVTSPLSAGTNSLIRDGARLVASAADVLEEFPHLRGRGETPLQLPILSEEERACLAELGREPVTVDELIRRSPLPASRTLALLTALEFRGLVRQLAGRRYARL